jgi:TraM recognition site of TraD and TraG/Type IV secretion-system coupling protein DNA-binding domain
VAHPFTQNEWSWALLTQSVPITCLSLIAFLKWWMDENPAETRAKELEQAESAEGTTYVAAGGKPWGIIPEAARQQQIANALRDTSPVVTLGTTTGLFAARGDFYAPNEGLPLSLSFQDLQTHLLVFGGTGSGKTSGILRPIARQFGQHDGIGMVIMDGKGSLPAELRDLPSMQLIDPAHHRVSLVAGLSPNIIVDTLVQILQGGEESGKDPFFVNNASSLLRRALILMQAASVSNPDYWTLMNAVRFASSEAYRETVLLDIPDAVVRQDPMIQEAFTFYMQSWPETEPKTQSNILATLRSWVSTITAERDLLEWAETPPHAETGIDLMACLRGGKIGFCLPSHRYGQAGAVVTALLKARLYAQLKARTETGIPDGETSVLFLIDEAQEVATNEDATMLAIGRSLGLAVVAATQGIEGINAQLGETVAAKWLSIYRNVMALASRSTSTDAFVAQRAGSSWQASLERVKGLTIRNTLAVNACTGAIAASRRQPHIAGVIEEVDLSASFLQRKIAEIAKGVLPNAKDQVEVKVGIRPILEAEELQNLLAEPDTAIALVNRGRVHRRDVIRLHPVYN